MLRCILMHLGRMRIIRLLDFFDALRGTDLGPYRIRIAYAGIRQRGEYEPPQQHKKCKQAGAAE